MQLERLDIREFRNLLAIGFTPHPRFNLLSGSNGQGKTNLLEAIHVLLCRRSFRSARLGDLLRHGAASAQVLGTVTHDGLEHRLAHSLTNRSRRTEMDGKALRGAATWPRAFTAVVFTPDDLVAPKGAPADRRRLLDEAIAAVWPPYADLSREYARCVSARNRVLKEAGAHLLQLLNVYDEQLAQLGAKLVAARMRYLRVLIPLFEDAVAQIARVEHTTMRYTASFGPLDADRDLRALTELMRSHLLAARDLDLARRTTTLGPHHDDLEFTLAGRPARTFASQGQLRALVLAFRIAQLTDCHQRTGHYPPLLLDDVSSELDAERSDYLFRFISERPLQVFVTTTRPDLIPRPNDGAHFLIAGGALRPLAL